MHTTDEVRHLHTQLNDALRRAAMWQQRHAAAVALLAQLAATYPDLCLPSAMNSKQDNKNHE